MQFLPIYSLLSPQLVQVMEYVTGKPFVEYLAEASPGTPVDSPLWRVRKFTYDGDDNLIRVQFANGSDEFNNTADGMSTLTYS